MLESTNVQLALIIAAASVLALLIVVGLPVWFTMRHARFERQLVHTERMKAMELGLPFPDAAAPGGDTESTLARPWTLIGVWVPLIVFGATLGAALWGEVSIPPGVWFAAGCIGVTGIICCTILLLQLPASTIADRSPGASSAKAPSPKPILDPDAFDTAGRRG
jgi:hypothetical protein